jgi:hypothetical protein
MGVGCQRRGPVQFAKHRSAFGFLCGAAGVPVASSVARKPCSRNCGWTARRHHICAALTQISVAVLSQKQWGLAVPFGLCDGDCQGFRAGLILTEGANAFLPVRAARRLLA